MSEQPKDGGPAFPTDRPTKVKRFVGREMLPDGDRDIYEEVTVKETYPGMSLRDWFAGQALAGLASNCNERGELAWMSDDMALAAYRAADAMLAAREVKP